LARLGLQIEELYRAPMDIEWAFVDEKFTILQARPITALPELKTLPPETSTGPVDWSLPNPKDVYMRGGVVDILPGLLSPLFESIGLPALVHGAYEVGRVLTHMKPVLPDGYYTSLNHFAYMNTHIPPRSWWWILSGLLPAFPRLLSSGHKILREQARPKYVEDIARWQDRSPERMEPAELWEGISQILRAAMFYLATMTYATMGASAGSEILFTNVYSRLVQKEGDPSVPTFLMGYDSLPIQAEKSLYDLAIWCRSNERLMAYIVETPTSEIATTLAGQGSPKDVQSEDWRSFQGMFQNHLRRFGHIIYSVDFAHPLPLDCPEPMLETMKMYLRGGGVNPHRRQAASEEKREQAVRKMLSRTKGLRRWAFRKSLGWAQTLSEIRENALADIGLGYPLLRGMLIELGRRLARNEAIDQAEDIYWMEREEIEKCIRTLESGETPANLADAVRKCRRDRDSLKNLTPPPMLPPKERIMGIKTGIYIAAAEGDQAGNVLKGVAASPGKVAAPACVLNEPQDFERMKPGAVLVAITTTPAWTPLFAMASAIVTDIGGPLSHGSIVAREYGIPAVMGTGVATKRIHDGQVISVDGDAGIVILKPEKDN
jgi:phosphohistidine swiveling domain-containing protein